MTFYRKNVTKSQKLWKIAKLKIDQIDLEELRIKI